MKRAIQPDELLATERFQAQAQTLFLQTKGVSSVAKTSGYKRARNLAPRE